MRSGEMQVLVRAAGRGVCGRRRSAAGSAETGHQLGCSTLLHVAGISTSRQSTRISVLPAGL